MSTENQKLIRLQKEEREFFSSKKSKQIMNTSNEIKLELFPTAFSEHGIHKNRTSVNWGTNASVKIGDCQASRLKDVLRTHIMLQC